MMPGYSRRLGECSLDLSLFTVLVVTYRQGEDNINVIKETNVINKCIVLWVQIERFKFIEDFIVKIKLHCLVHNTSEFILLDCPFAQRIEVLEILLIAESIDLCEFT